MNATDQRIDDDEWEDHNWVSTTAKFYKQAQLDFDMH